MKYPPSRFLSVTMLAGNTDKPETELKYVISFLFQNELSQELSFVFLIESRIQFPLRPKSYALKATDWGKRKFFFPLPLTRKA